MTSSFKLTALEIDGGAGPLSSPFELELDFILTRPSADLSFSLSYLVDGMLKRHVVPLLTTDPTPYSEGANSLLLSVSSVDVSNVEPGRLANAGLLSIDVLEGGEEVCTINCVVMVREVGGEFEREIYSPFE
ncbi:hypothetical protein TrCOL_g157 [Triparma columacea]|uniref:Uncharacterized protein n=1 Tax=Triparma columacea TaxID=722753 RepID=A0A9W7GJR7_9STRA|nr:hypothetical protein TrCOL_g157 [Triparma columacea]